MQDCPYTQEQLTLQAAVVSIEKKRDFLDKKKGKVCLSPFILT